MTLEQPVYSLLTSILSLKSSLRMEKGIGRLLDSSLIEFLKESKRHNQDIEKVRN